MYHNPKARNYSTWKSSSLNIKVKVSNKQTADQVLPLFTLQSETSLIHKKEEKEFPSSCGQLLALFFHTHPQATVKYL